MNKIVVPVNISVLVTSTLQFIVVFESRQNYLQLQTVCIFFFTTKAQRTQRKFSQRGLVQKSL